MHLQLRDVEYFAAIAEHGQVQRAAEALGLSQPGLSKSLRRLEQAMNTKLLKRTPKGVELTRMVAALLARTEKLRLSLNDVAREITDLSEGRAGHLRIATATGASMHLVPAACEALLKEAPNVTFKLTVSDANAMLTDVRNGELYLAVGIRQDARYEDMIVEHTHDDTYTVYASAHHRLAKRKQLVLADLAGERWIMAAANALSERTLSQAYAAAGLPPPRVAIETTSPSIRHHLIAATDFLALATTQTLPYIASQFDIVELRLKDFAVSRKGGVMYRKDAYLPPAAVRFIEILKATAKKIARETR